MQYSLMGKSSWNKWILGGLGWALGGPIGGILGFAIGSISEDGLKLGPLPGMGGQPGFQQGYLPNDFSAALLVLCAAVMKADQRVMRSELEFVRTFFSRQFGEAHTQERMLLFREILKQDIAIGQVCQQVRQNVDPPSRLELIHLLFGVAATDGPPGIAEVTVIAQISTLIGISRQDFESIRAMFVREMDSAYKILEIEKSASDDDVKKAFRKMALKFHPDKVHHLGPEYQKDAQEKFKKINEAYAQIKRERGMS